MKAAVFRAFGQPLVLETLPDPTPGAGEIVVRVGRCGICGSDLHMTHEPDFGTVPGSVLGHEFAGEVVALGRGAEGFAVGDRVVVEPVRGCGHCPACLAGKPSWCKAMTLQGGGYAEYTTTTPRQCFKMPATTTLADGALVEPLAVALHGVMLSGLAPGARVLVMGAAKVVVADLTTLQQDLAYRLGATGFVTVEEDAVGRVQGALGGPPDIVLECVGRPGILAQALEHVAPHGTIVMLGLCTALDSFVPFRAVSKEVKIQTAAFYTMREFQAALDALDGGLQPPTAMITETVSLAAMPEAFEALRKRTRQCKVMVEPG